MNKKVLISIIVVLSILLVVVSSVLVVNIFSDQDNNLESEVLEDDQDDKLEDNDNLDNDLEDNNNDEAMSNDTLVLSEVNNIESDIVSGLENNLSAGLVNLKGGFIILVDFIFYDGLINGISFNDLSDSAKESVLNTVSDIDKFVISYYPNYKEDVLNLNKSVSDSLFNAILIGKDNIEDFATTHIDPDTLDSIKEFSDEFNDSLNGVIDSPLIDEGFDAVIEGYEGLSDSLDEWYQEFKKD